MQRPDRLRLQHMLEAAREAQVSVAAKSRKDLDADRMLQFALVRTIEIFGEAASQISGGESIATQHLPLEGGHRDAQSPHPCLLQYRPRHLVEYDNRDLPTLIHEIERALESIGA